MKIAKASLLGFGILTVMLFMASGVHNGSVLSEKSPEKTSPTKVTITKLTAQQALEKHSPDAEGCNIMVMDVTTGTLLLDYSMEKKNSSQSNALNSNTLIEPGTLLSTAVISTLLDDPAVELDTAMLLRVHQKSYLDGKIKVEDAHRIHSKDSLPLHTAFSLSSNVASCELGDHYYSAIPDTLGARLHRLFPSAKITALSTMQTFYRLCMGYGISLPSTDILTFYSAVANGGVDPVSGRRMCSSQTAKTLTGLLREVVEEGTARSIETNEYPIAGKTAMVSPSFGGGRTYMFVGYVPSNNPQYACLVTIKGNDSSSKATKVFKEIADYLMK